MRASLDEIMLPSSTYCLSASPAELRPAPVSYCITVRRSNQTILPAEPRQYRFAVLFEPAAPPQALEFHLHACFALVIHDLPACVNEPDLVRQRLHRGHRAPHVDRVAEAHRCLVD